MTFFERSEINYLIHNNAEKILSYVLKSKLIPYTEPRVLSDFKLLQRKMFFVFERG